MSRPARPALPLRSPRLLIRDVTVADAPAVQRYAGDPEVVKWMEWGPNTPAVTRAFLRGLVRTQRARPRTAYELAIILRAGRELVGGIGLRVGNPKHRSADMGYVLARRWWGRGIMTEAARAMLAFGFRRLKLHRIWATCDVRNRGSARVLEKIGMRREGRKRHDQRLRGRWRDSFFYAILENEWKARRAR